MTSHKVFSPNFFADQVLLITGGGSGIGEQCAFQAASLGAKGIAICGRREAPLAKVAESIESSYPNVKVFYASCTLLVLDCFI